MLIWLIALCFDSIFTTDLLYCSIKSVLVSRRTYVAYDFCDFFNDNRMFQNFCMSSNLNDKDSFFWLYKKENINIMVSCAICNIEIKNTTKFYLCKTNMQTMYFCCLACINGNHKRNIAQSDLVFYENICIKNRDLFIILPAEIISSFIEIYVPLKKDGEFLISLLKFEYLISTAYAYIKRTYCIEYSTFLMCKEKTLEIYKFYLNLFTETFINNLNVIYDSQTSVYKEPVIHITNYMYSLLIQVIDTVNNSNDKFEKTKLERAKDFYNEQNLENIFNALDKFNIIEEAKVIKTIIIKINCFDKIKYRRIFISGININTINMFKLLVKFDKEKIIENLNLYLYTKDSTLMIEWTSPDFEKTTRMRRNVFYSLFLCVIMENALEISRYYNLEINKIKYICWYAAYCEGFNKLKVMCRISDYKSSNFKKGLKKYIYYY